jgi:protoporphyrinogen oxidase
MKKTAIIIGAGPAGLTAAHTLLKKTDIHPVIFEKDTAFGGISQTVNYKGNRIDIGGHRFFSKSDIVMDFWKSILPVQGAPAKDELVLGTDTTDRLEEGGPDPEQTDRVMLIRNRLSRIYYLRRFFSYPVTLSVETIKNLGLFRISKIGLSYLSARLFPKQEHSLEDFFVNRFGRELYLTFFKEYTEKVWGVPCSKIRAEWGKQRIKGLSITKAVAHAISSLLKHSSDINQKKTETSLIERFLYPKYGPGQMWEAVAHDVRVRGGDITLGQETVSLEFCDGHIASITVQDRSTVTTKRIEGDYFLSSMPVRELVARLDGPVPENVREAAAKLQYRDFMTVGLLMKRLTIKNETTIKTVGDIIPDNWIYIQEPGVKVGRLQIFNNWSPYMVRDPETVWIGMEYFVNEDDELWTMADADFSSLAARELASIGIIATEDVLDSVVIRVEKAYPSYTGEGYDRFAEIQEFLDTIPNLFLIGRNGMHRYNNQDHSMLTAMEAVENITLGKTSKENIWGVNAEQEYHEEKKS